MVNGQGLLRPIVGVFAVLSLIAVGTAAVVSRSIPFPNEGETMGGSAGQVVPLSSTSFLAGTSGMTGQNTSADDVTLLVTGLDAATPTVVTLPTPFLSSYSGKVARLSATRVAMFHAGNDGSWLTADDGFYVIDRIGSTNRVESVVVGFLDERDMSAPVGLDEETVILTTYGVDGKSGTSDDRIALVTGLGNMPVVTYLPAPNLHRQGSGRPVALDDGSFLVVSVGPDGNQNTGDEVTWMFTDVGSGNTRTELATPGFIGNAPGLPVALSATRALICANGPDLSQGTADDLVYLLDDLAGTPTVTPVAVPFLTRGGTGRPVRVDDTTACFLSLGADGTELTADDALVVLTDLGGTNEVTSTVVGSIATWGFQPSLLDPETLAVQTAGPDGNFENGDDEVVVISDFRGTPTLVRHRLSGLDGGQSSQAVPLGRDAFIVSNAGPDGVLDAGEDDEFAVVTGATSSSPTVESLPIDGENNTYWASQLPQYLGAGRAAVVSGGADQMVTSGGDDVFQVLTGLPSTRGLVVKNARLSFRDTRPEKGEKAIVKATLVSDGADPFAGLGVIVSVGNAAQYIPAADLTLKNGTWKYRDPKGARGWIRNLSYKVSTGKLKIKGKGLATGLESTLASSIAVAIDGDAGYYGQTLAGNAIKAGLKYKAPK